MQDFRHSKELYSISDCLHSELLNRRMTQRVLFHKKRMGTFRIKSAVCLDCLCHIKIGVIGIKFIFDQS